MNPLLIDDFPTNDLTRYEWYIYIYVCPTVHNAVPRPQQKINHCTLLNAPVLH